MCSSTYKFADRSPDKYKIDLFSSFYTDYFAGHMPDISDKFSSLFNGQLAGLYLAGLTQYFSTKIGRNICEIFPYFL